MRITTVEWEMENGINETQKLIHTHLYIEERSTSTKRLELSKRKLRIAQHTTIASKVMAKFEELEKTHRHTPTGKK